MFWSKIFMNSLVSSDVLAIDRKLFLLWVQRFYNFFRFFNWKQNMEINFNFSLRKRWKAELKLDFMNFIQLWLLRSLWSKTLIETSRTVIKGVTNLLGNSWTRCWSFSFIWRFCCFQIRKFHVRHVKSQNLPPIRMPNIIISWDVGQQKCLFCLSLLTSLVLPLRKCLSCQAVMYGVCYDWGSIATCESGPHWSACKYKVCI